MPANLHQMKSKEEPSKETTKKDIKQPKPVSSQPDKYSFIDAEIESEMSNFHMDSMKEGEYYDKAYNKDHDS